MKNLLIFLILFTGCGKSEEQVAPNPSRPELQNQITDSYKFYQSFIAQGVPTIPLEDALNYYEDNLDKFTNKRYISIADYTINSKNRRFFLLDMQTGEVQKEQVSHGSGAVNTGMQKMNFGDPDHDGMLDRCVHYSSRARHPRVNMTRPGFMITSRTYKSSKDFPRIGYKNHNAMKLIGLEQRNDDALRNGVVMHEATYNVDGKLMGRSWGCPAFVPTKGADIFLKIKGGSLFYSYAPQCD